MRRFILIAIILLGSFLIANYLFSDKVKFESIKSINIGNARISVEVSDDLGEQVQGLSGRDSLCETCGMLFIYREPQIQTFWMKDMKFPLDLIFIREGKVVEIFENVPIPEPGKDIPKVQSTQSADMVLEVNAGFTQLKEIKVGDIIVGDIMKLD